METPPQRDEDGEKKGGLCYVLAIRSQDVTEISLLPSILQLNFCIFTACFQIGQYFVATEGVMTDKSSTKYTVEIVYNVMKGTGYFVSFEAIIWRIGHCNRNKKRKIEMAGTCGEDE
jgi:hypothetical protein